MIIESHCSYNRTPAEDEKKCIQKGTIINLLQATSQLIVRTKHDIGLV